MKEEIRAVEHIGSFLVAGAIRRFHRVVLESGEGAIISVTPDGEDARKERTCPACRRHVNQCGEVQALQSRSIQKWLQ